MGTMNPTHALKLSVASSAANSLDIFIPDPNQGPADYKSARPSGAQRRAQPPHQFGRLHGDIQFDGVSRCFKNGEL